jgi:hypothetical protein
MEEKRNLNLKVNTSIDLTKLLTELLVDLRRGEVDHETAKGMTLIADKINKNNFNAIVYKKVSKHKYSIAFFKEE